MSEIEIDTENELENEYGPRFSKALMGRILAVSLFVVLGTVAVVHSMKDKPAAAAQLGPDGQPISVEEDKDKKDNKENGPEGKTSFADAGKSTSLKTDPFADKNKTTKASLTGSSFANTNPALTPKTKPSSSFAPTGFGASQKKMAPPISAAKPTIKPPVRLAQAGSGAPLGGSSGFRGGPPVVKSQGFGANVSSTVNNTKTALKDFKNGIGNAAANTTAKAKSAANDLRNGANKALGGFGAPAGPPAQKSFAPPAVNSNFGQPGSTPGSIAKGGSNFKSNAPPNLSSRPVPKASFDSSRALTPPQSTVSTSRPDNNPFGDGAAAPPIRKIDPAPTRPAPSGQNGFGGQSNRGPNSGFANNKPPSNPRAFTAQPTSRPAAQPTSRPTAGSTAPIIPASSNRINSKSNFTSNNNNRSTPSSLGGTAPPPTRMLTKNVPGERSLEGIQAPALTVQKLSPREIQLNAVADFEIVVKNVGRVAAENVRVFDQIPDGAQMVSSTPVPTKTSAARNIEWNIGSMRPGQEKRIKIQLKPTRPGEIGSVAHVTFATQASMRTLVTKPELEIIHQSEPKHLIGDEVILDVVVKNKGDGPAKNVLIQEDVPMQLDSPIGREIEYEIGTLLPGKSRRVRLALKAAQVGRIQNVMFASAEGGLRAQHKIDLEVVAPKLVTKSDGPTIRYLKRSTTHSFSVANKGTAPATNVELIARLPSGLRFVSANNQGTYAANTHSVFWSLAELSEGIEAQVDLKTMPIEVGNQPIKFEALADLNIKSEANQPLAVEHLVDVFFDIDDVVDPIEIGSGTSYKIRVVNQGTKAATNVKLLVDFPQGLSPTSIDGSLRHQINGQRITFEPIASMNPGDEIDIVVNATGKGRGDHRVVVNMQTDGRQTAVSKEETTRVYSDR